MIPELHDVGKLLGLEKHWFEGMEKPYLVDNSNEDTWLAIRFHRHEESLSPDDKRVFNELRQLHRGATNYSSYIRHAMVLISLADGASASSRMLSEEAKKKVRGYFKFRTPPLCLWMVSDPPVVTETERHGNPSQDEIANILSDALSAKSWEDFKQKHECALSLTPEDKHPLRAMTSLGVHCELVGKLFRILDSAVTPRPDNLDGKLFLGETKVANMKEAERTWSLRILRADISIPQRVAHAGDVHIFTAVEDALERIGTGEHRDHVIFTASQAIWLFLLPGQEDKLSEILRPLLDLGVVVSTVERESKFNKVGFPLSDELEAAKDESHGFQSLPDLLPQAGEQICEVCQIREGELRDPDPESGVVEVLCCKCSKIREQGCGFHNLKEWDEGPVLWCRVALDGQGLPDHLTHLYKSYLQKLKYENGDRVVPDTLVKELVASLQLAALLAEYADDYRQFVSHFWKRVETGLDSLGLDRSSSLELITHLPEEASDLFAVRVDVPGVPDMILDAFRGALVGMFPVSAQQDDCPIRIGLSLAHAKHPFFLHWDRLKELKKTVNLFSPARRSVCLRLDGLEDVREIANQLGNTYLHNLAEIESRTHSRLMAEVKLIEDRKSHLLEAARNVGLESVLGYQAVAGAGGE